MPKFLHPADERVESMPRADLKRICAEADALERRELAAKRARFARFAIVRTSGRCQQILGALPLLQKNQ